MVKISEVLRWRHMSTYLRHLTPFSSLFDLKQEVIVEEQYLIYSNLWELFSPGSLVLTDEIIVKYNRACFAISLIYSDFKT